MNVKSGLIFLLIFLVSGCSKTTYIHHEQILASQKEIPKEERSPILPKSGVIKGLITEVYLDGMKALWVHEVRSKDTTNGKLEHIKFSHAKIVAKKGQGIYVVVKDEKLVEFYLLENPNIIKSNPKKSKKQEVQKSKKRTKARKTPWLALPQSESIDLD